MPNAPVTGGGTAEWWVVNNPIRGGGRLPVYTTHYVVVQSAGTPDREVSGPYSTKAEAESYLTSANNYGNNPVSAAGQAASDAANATGLGAIGDFFSKLGNANTWVRVGQVIVGVILLAVGVARITHAVPVATKIAKTAGAVAI